jgi:hypothetical protein
MGPQRFPLAAWVTTLMMLEARRNPENRAAGQIPPGSDGSDVSSAALARS